MTVVSNKNHVIRLFEMIFTIYNKHKNLDLVLIDTFSGKSYYFAILSSYVCYFLNLKYILVLRGDLKMSLEKTNYKKIFLIHVKLFHHRLFFEKSLNRIQIKTTYIPNYIDIENYRFSLRKKCVPNFYE